MHTQNVFTNKVVAMAAAGVVMVEGIMVGKGSEPGPLEEFFGDLQWRTS